jgi:hypothetical protein
MYDEPPAQQSTTRVEAAVIDWVSGWLVGCADFHCLPIGRPSTATTRSGCVHLQICTTIVGALFGMARERAKGNRSRVPQRFGIAISRRDSNISTQYAYSHACLPASLARSLPHAFQLICIVSSIDDPKVSVIRQKLIKFLRESTHFQPPKILGHLLSDFPSMSLATTVFVFLVASWFDSATASLFEERAVLFSKLGRHEQALRIYAGELRSFKLAEEYCEKAYAEDPDGAKNVYLALLDVLVYPSDGKCARTHAHTHTHKERRITLREY